MEIENLTITYICKYIFWKKASEIFWEILIIATDTFYLQVINFILPESVLSEFLVNQEKEPLQLVAILK